MLHEKSSNSVKMLALDREQALNKLVLCAQLLVKNHPEVIGVVLFGSLARGEQVGTSDADLIVIVEEKSKSIFEQMQHYSTYFDLPIGVDMLLFSQDEIADFKKNHDPFWKMVEKEGVVLV